MRFHSDPLYDTWDDITAVVSVGHPRAFVLRAAADASLRWTYQVSNHQQNPPPHM
jgi:hypothetical protein